MTKSLFLSVCEQDAYNFGGSVGPQMAGEGRGVVGGGVVVVAVNGDT